MSTPFSLKILILILITALTACDKTDPVESSPKASTEAVDQGGGENPDLELAERAGAPLFTGMGDYTMEITTNDPGAQRYFSQGKAAGRQYFCQVS